MPKLLLAIIFTISTSYTLVHLDKTHVWEEGEDGILVPDLSVIGEFYGVEDKE